MGHPLGANPGDVWAHATSSVRSIHHAMFPESLVERPILATCPERVCARCGTPWQRTAVDPTRRLDALGQLVAPCSCATGWRPGLVFDPFIGAGTTAIVAERHGRDWLGIELKPEYTDVARKRIERARPQSDTEMPMAA